MLARVRTLSADDPQSVQLRQTAKTAIDQGQYAQAEAWLNKVSAQEVAAISELHDLMAPRMRSAAEAKAANGALKMTQLAYAAAADYYCQATAFMEQMPAGSDEPLALYLTEWGALYDAQGRYSEAEPLYQRALTIYEAVLGGQHPHVAIIREHYTALLRATNRNEEAEKLAARAQTERHSRI